jgi:hypothetical protein
MFRILMIAGVLMAATGNALAKQCSTYYTPERIAVGRENVSRYAWAQAVRDRIMKGAPITYYIGNEYISARDYAAQSDEFMWTLQPSTLIPRVFPHESKALCPVHGVEVRKHSGWCAWRIDPIKHPYKVQCIVGGEWYPSNDFLKGDMTSGPFPDDGSGCEYKGKRYYFLRDYAHMAYGGATIPGLRALSQAYLLTGDRRYAHKGAILLARLASEYPNHEERKDRLYYATTGGRDPHYKWKTGGMITDLIWETFCLEATAYAYDAFYPYLAEDPELLVFLRQKGMPVGTPDDLRRYIEEKLLRSGMKGLLNGAIHGNEGFHQAAALACALVMDDFSDAHPNSKDMVDYAYLGPGHAAYVMDNGLTRDGGGHESPNYNEIKLDFIRVAQLMEEIRRRRPDLFPVDKYPDLFAGPKAKALFDYFIDMLVLDTYSPSVGDSGGMQEPRREKTLHYSLVGAQNVFAFQRYGDPRYARACTKPDGRLFTGTLFDPYPEDRIKAALARPESRIVRASRLLDGYGLAILESGEDPDRRAAVLNYTSLIGHRQCDHLALELFARGVRLFPDLGYPFTWDYRWEWDSNSMAHNTVTVDETQPATSIGGAAHLFASTGGVHVVTAHHDPYPEGFRPDDKCAKGVDLYERTVVMVDVEPGRFYVVDLFAVAGGEQHDQSWHGPFVPMQPPPLNWERQEGGTLAGKEVAQFAEYTDRWGRKKTDFPCFLADIRRARLVQPAVWRWDLGLPEGDALCMRLVPVGGPMEVILGRGRSPARSPEWGVEYVIARRCIKNGERSLFLTVLDTFQKTPVVKDVRLISESPLVLQVIHDSGTDEIHIGVPPGPSRTTDPRPVGVRVCSRAGGRVARDVQVGEWAPGQGPGYASGVVRAVDYAQNRIAIDCAPAGESDFSPGRAVRIFNRGRSALFRVRDMRRDGERFWITLDRTALLARGPVAETGDGAVTLSSYFTFANGSMDDKGALKPGLNSFAGSWVGEGQAARLVRGAVKGDRSKVFLSERIPVEALRRDYAGRVVSLWQYGIGDRVEAARIQGAIGPRSLSP